MFRPFAFKLRDASTSDGSSGGVKEFDPTKNDVRIPFIVAVYEQPTNELVDMEKEQKTCDKTYASARGWVKSYRFMN